MSGVAPHAVLADAGRTARTARPTSVLGVAQALSGDVLLGVLGGAALATQVARASMPAAWWVLLPAATWIVYSLDRQLDVRGRLREPRSARHRFHLRHGRAVRRHVAWVVGATCAAAAVLLPAPLLIVGGGLGTCVVGYLWAAQHARRRVFPKEVAAASLYATGIWFAPLMLGHAERPWIALVAGLHGLAALLNLLAFSLFELPEDRLDGQRSFATSWGPGTTRWVLGGLTVVGLLTAAVGSVVAPPELALVWLVLAVVIGLPWCMVRFETTFAVSNRYRVYGDLAFAVLCLPWLVDAFARVLQ